eukprot:Lithocolla_globosa_v1_NODE_122_length_6074_cov_8.352550.p2 type:complete len:528 gc:universal NODE_122_length_6074_cov_8.352550:2583-1000(-)
MVSFIPDFTLVASGASVSSLAAARTGRAARASARAARIVRVVRIAKINKLFPSKHTKKGNDDGYVKSMLDEQASATLQPSGVGRRLINRTTNKVISIVLLLYLVFIITVFPYKWQIHAENQVYMIEASFLIMGNTSMFADYVNDFIYFYEENDPVLVNLDINNVSVFSVDEFESIRPIFLEASTTVTSFVTSYISVQAHLQLESGLNILTLLVILCVLVLGNWLISRDANHLIIIPLERVMAVVRLLMKNTNKLEEAKMKQLVFGNNPQPADTETDELFSMLTGIGGSLQAAVVNAETQAKTQKVLLGRMQEIFIRGKYKEMALRQSNRAQAQAQAQKPTKKSASTVDLMKSTEFEDPSMETKDEENNKGVDTTSNKDGAGGGGDGSETTNPVEGTPDAPFVIQKRDPTAPDVEFETTGGHIQIRAATLERLIAQLTKIKFMSQTDLEFRRVFMSTFRSYTTAEEVMEMLIMRYCIYYGMDMEGEELIDVSDEVLEKWRVEVQVPVRQKVIQIITVWCSDFFFRFQE